MEGGEVVAKRTGRNTRHDSDGRYLKLIKAFPLRPIRTESELDRAIAVIDSLVLRDDLDPGEADYLDVLGDLVYKYEAANHPIRPVSDSEMLRFLLDSSGVSQAELAERSRIAASTISEILAGKRRLSRRQIVTLSTLFRLSPAVFFPETLEMTSDRAAGIISRQIGKEMTRESLISLASAFAFDTGRASWRSLQEMMAGEKPGTPANLMANRLNSLVRELGGTDCWFPVRVELTEADLQALARIFASEDECWMCFRDMVEEAIPHMRELQKGFAEEN
jgi:HTH-type transcriptional regulator/antitoxin HigA